MANETLTLLADLTALPCADWRLVRYTDLVAAPKQTIHQILGLVLAGVMTAGAIQVVRLRHRKRSRNDYYDNDNNHNANW